MKNGLIVILFFVKKKEKNTIILFISESNILQETFGPARDAGSFANDTIDDTIESQRYFLNSNTASPRIKQKTEFLGKMCVPVHVQSTCKKTLLFL